MYKRAVPAAFAAATMLAAPTVAGAQDSLGQGGSLELTAPEIEVPLAVPTSTIGDSAPIVVSPGTTSDQVSVSISMPTASSGQTGVTPIRVTTPIVDVNSGTSQTGPGSSSGAVISTGQLPVGSADVVSSSASVISNSSRAHTAAVRVDIFHLTDAEVWVLRSTASSGTADSPAEVDAVFLRTGEHTVEVLHTGSTPSHSALLVFDGDGVITDEELGDRCAVDTGNGVAANCLSVQEGDDILVGELLGADAALGDAPLDASAGLLGARTQTGTGDDTTADGDDGGDDSDDGAALPRADGGDSLEALAPGSPADASSKSGLSRSELAYTGFGTLTLVLIAGGLISAGLALRRRNLSL